MTNPVIGTGLHKGDLGPVGSLQDRCQDHGEKVLLLVLGDRLSQGQLLNLFKDDAQLIQVSIVI